MMPIPLGGSDLGIGDMSIDMGMGSDFGSGGCPDDDCDTINPNNPIELDTVVITSKKKPQTQTKNNEGTDDGILVTGFGTEDRGTKEGTRKGSVDMNEMPGGTAGAAKTTNWLMNFVRELLDFLDLASRTKKTLKPNESTMENKNEEPVNPPEADSELIKWWRYYHTDTIKDGKPTLGKTKVVDTVLKRENKSKLDSLNMADFFKAIKRIRKKRIQ